MDPARCRRHGLSRRSHRGARRPGRARQRRLEPPRPSLHRLGGGGALGIARPRDLLPLRVGHLVRAAAVGGRASLRSALDLRACRAHAPCTCKVGIPASHYLDMRVAMGLESVAEGEAAVGRQVLRGFERSHADARTDKVLNAGWRIVGALIHRRRVLAPSASAIGVHSLVVDALEERLKGRAYGAGVRPGADRQGRSRARSPSAGGSRGEDLQPPDGRRLSRRDRRGSAACVIICSGADAAWLALPSRKDKPLAIDIGSPEQIAVAPGWERIALDHLLAHGASRCRRPSASRSRPW